MHLSLQADREVAFEEILVFVPVKSLIFLPIFTKPRSFKQTTSGNGEEDSKLVAKEVSIFP